VGYCEAVGCEEPVDRWGRFCAGHAKQFQRHGHTTALREELTPKERLVAAMDAIRDCDAENDLAYHRAWNRFWKAVRETRCRDCQGPVKLERRDGHNVVLVAKRNPVRAS